MPEPAPADGPRVVVLAGGVGGSKFVLGLRDALRLRAAPPATVVVNTGDDLWLSGVRLQPDVDSLVYALGGANDTERGWGRAGDSERVNAELQAWGAGWPWFTLGDLDLGLHLARTGWLREGLSPTQVIERMQRRWDLGVRLLPMTDARCTSRSGGRATARRCPRRASRTPASPAPSLRRASSRRSGTPRSCCSPRPTRSCRSAPSWPCPASATRCAARARVVGVSPIIGGAVVRGMADVCLTAIGVATDAAAFAAHYGARPAGGVLDAWLLAAGIRAVVAPLWMRDAETSAALAEAALRA